MKRDGESISFNQDEQLAGLPRSVHETNAPLLIDRLQAEQLRLIDRAETLRPQPLACSKGEARFLDEKARRSGYLCVEVAKNAQDAITAMIASDAEEYLKSYKP